MALASQRCLSLPPFLLDPYTWAAITHLHSLGAHDVKNNAVVPELSGNAFFDGHLVVIIVHMIRLRMLQQSYELQSLFVDHHSTDLSEVDRVC